MIFKKQTIFRYRPEPQSRQPRSWTEISDIKETEYILNDLDPGEQYEIEVDSVSHHVLSGKPMSTFQIIDPKSVENLQPILDAENVTLQWPRPEGKVDVYHIKWYPISNENDVRQKEIPGKYLYFPQTSAACLRIQGRRNLGARGATAPPLLQVLQNQEAVV